MRLEFDAIDDGVVERGGCESPREPIRFDVARTMGDGPGTLSAIGP